MAGHPIDIQIGATLSGTLGAAVRGAQSQLNQLGSTISDLSNQQAGVGRLGNMRGQTAQAAQSMRAAQARVRAAQAAVDAAGPGNATRTQTRELERAIAAAGRAEQAYRRQRTAVDELTESLRRAGVDTRNLGNEQTRIGQQLERVRQRTEALTRATQAQQRNMENRGAYRAQMMDAAALGMALGAPIKKAAEFEQAMANVGAVAKASDEDLGKLTKQARDLGATTNWTASQAAEGMKFLAMAGFDTSQTMAAMPGMLNLASAGAIELGEAADIASNILSGFGIEAAQMGRVGDVLTNTFNSSNTDLRMLGETMKYVAPVAKALNVSIEEVAAMTGKLGDAGIQGSEAGTALRAIMIRLASGKKPVADALDQLGISAKDAGGNLRPMPDLLDDINRATAEMGSADRVKLLSQLFGVEASAAGIELLNHAGEGLANYTERLKESGTAAKTAERQNATTIGALKRLGSAMESMAISIGSVLLPPLAQLADRLAPIITGMSAWAEAHPQLTTALVGTLAGAMALKIGVIGLGYAFTFIKGPILAARTAFAMIRAQLALISVGAASSAGPLTLLGAAFGRATTAVRAFSLALVANPVGLTIAAIGAAVVGLALVIRKYWEPLSAWVSGFFQGISAAIEPAMAGISTAMEPIKTAFAPLAPIFSAIGSAISTVVNWFGQLLKPVQLTGQEFEAISAKGQAFGQMIGGALNTALTAITPILQGLATVLGTVVQGWTLLGQAAMQAWTALTTALSDPSPLQALKNLGSQLVQALANLPAAFMEIGGQIIGGLINGIKAKAAAAVEAVKSTVGNIVAGAKSKLGIQSPSRVFAAIGEQINAGLAQGLKNSAGQVIQTMQGLWDQLQSLLDPKQLLGNLVQAGTNWLSKTLDGLFGGSVSGGLGDMLGGLFSGGSGSSGGLGGMLGGLLGGGSGSSGGLGGMLGGLLGGGSKGGLFGDLLGNSFPNSTPGEVGKENSLGSMLGGLLGGGSKGGGLATAFDGLFGAGPSESSATALPMAAPAPALAGAGGMAGGGNIQFAPRITIQVAAGQGDPEDLAQLIESRLHGMFRNTLRGAASSMFD